MRRFGPLLSLLLLVVPAAGLASPVVAAPQVHYDFGVVAQGVRVEHDFEVMNAGDEELVIQRLTGS